MGRPIQKKYFGNTNEPPVGGEGVASIAVTGTNNNYTVKPTVSIAAPTLPGGVQAVASVSGMGVASVSVVAGGTGYTNGDVLTIVGLGAGTAATITVTNAIGGVIQAGGVSITTAGDYSTVTDVTALAVTGGTGNNDATFDVVLKINAITVTTAGSGYVSTAVPAVSTTPSGNATLTATLTSSNVDAIVISAFVKGGSSAVTGDIVKQEASRRYLVTTAQGTSDCSLVAAPPAEGEMTMTAVDSAGGQYYIIKLTQGKALIVKGGRTGTEFDTSSFVINSIARLDGVVSVTTGSAHNFVDGAQVYIFGVTGATDTFNGVFNVDVTSSTTFTYTQNGADESGTVGANSNASAGAQVPWVVTPESAELNVSVRILTQ